MWIRTCQECGHRQKDVQPTREFSDAYANRKCKKCKSSGLDYGKKVDDAEIQTSS